MKNINKDNFSDFEREWQQAFEDAEMEPGKDIWNNIDAKLANKETDKYKRRIVYYRWMTAASVIFAIGLSYFSLNYAFNGGLANEGSETNSPGVVGSSEPVTAGEQDQRIEPLNPSEGLAKEVGPDAAIDSKGDSPQVAYGEGESNEQLVDSQNISGVKSSSALKSNLSAGSVAENSNKETKDETNTQTHSENWTINAREEGDELQIAESKTLMEDDPALSNDEDVFNENAHAAMLAASSGSDESSEGSANINAGETIVSEAGLNSLNGYAYNDMLYAELMDPPYIYSIPGVALIREDVKDDNKQPKLWAGLNVGSSLFDPNFDQGSNFQPKTSPALANFSSDDGARVLPQTASFNESTDPGISYSVGVNFGLRLTEKWVIQSGIAYAHRSASTNSTTNVRNVANDIKTPANFGNVATESDKNVLTSVTQDYQLLNSFQFASVPLKAGYLLVDRKFGIMVLAGVSADFFLSNTLSESDDKIEEVKVAAGSDSPFRDVNFNGVIGAEFSYRLSRNYHLTIEPNYGVALNSFTKSGSSFTSNPQTFGIAAGLKFYWK